ATLAFPAVAMLGYVYCVVVTCLSTVLQDHLPNEVRGRVMALWIMGFGGTVPLGVLAAGPFSERHSTAVLLVGAAWALVLALWSNAGRLRRKGASDV
ncbi:MAG TPA: MFS transporter, partial [Acidimicrobiia bacterium]|nr:MFS transporter [Acidimicrobiia bacterium]